jgi:hypothetical protein
MKYIKTYILSDFLKYFTFITTTVCFWCINLSAKDNTNYLDVKNFAIGVFGATGLNIHSPDFPKLLGTPNCCNNFDNGLGVGLNLGMVFQYPLASKLELDLRASMFDLGGDLISEQVIPISDLDNSNSTDIAKTEFLISTELIAIGISPGINYYPIQYLYLHTGLFAGYVSKGTFSQEERLTAPENRGIFKDTGTRKRNIYAGEIPELTSYNLFLNLGIGYSLLLNDRGTFLLVPEFNINFGLTDVNSQPWAINQFTFGLALMFNSLSRNYDTPINPLK